MNDRRKYRAFISYSHEDAPAAKWMQRAIETYRLPRQLVRSLGFDGNRLGKVFRDRDELGSASSLSDAITAALDESECLIVICSPAVIKSNWVIKEVVYFRSQYPDRPILPLIVEGDPDSVLPDVLRFNITPEGDIGNVVNEPLAVHLEEGKSSARARMVAGILGVSFDDLRQRDLHRRQRRLIIIAAAALVGMTATSALSIYALAQRDRAEREAVIAEKVTDFLVNLFESSDPFAESGGDMTADEILEQGVDRIDRELEQEPIVRARLLATMGKVHTQLGLYDDAERMLNQAFVIQQNHLDMDSVQILRTQIDRAWLAGQTEKIEIAQQIYDEILPKLREGEKYVDVVPATAEWATAINDYGAFQWFIGDYEYAKVILNEALQIEDQVFGPEHRDVAATLANLALATQDSGDLVSALALYERSLAIREKIDGLNHPALVPILGNLASTTRSLGEFEAARSHLERALTIVEDRFEPNHPVNAWLNNGLGIVLFRLEDYDQALDKLETAEAIWAVTYGMEYSGIAANLQHRARVFHAMGNLDEARKYYEKSARTYEVSLGADHPEIIGVLIEMAEVLEQMGDIDGAYTYFERAVYITNQKFEPSDGLTSWVSQRNQEFLERNDLTSE